MEQNNILLREDFVKHGEKRHSPIARRSLMELNERERGILESIYKGLVIEAIESLEENEIDQFSVGNPVFNFHLQTLYKYAGELEPTRFTGEIRRMIDTEEYLRSNYCFLDGEMCRVILSEGDDRVNIICQDLSHLEQEELDITLERIIEADMHQEFDLQGGPLFRVYSFKTGDMEYAVLLTISNLIAPYFNMEKLLRRMGENREPASEITSGVLVDNSGQGDVKSASERYIVSDTDQMQSLPYERSPHGEYCQVIYRKTLPGNISTGLLRLMSGNRKLLIAALKTAWGLLVMENKSSEEIFSPLLLSASKGNSDSFFMLSACMRKGDDVSIEHTVAEQAAQIEEKSKTAEAYYDRILCSHFLSFYDFLHDRKPYSEYMANPEGTVILRNIWAASGVKLGVYFRWMNGSIYVTFIYDKSRFKPYSIELISQKYLQILQKMLFDWKQPISDFTGDISAADMIENEGKTSHDAGDDTMKGLYNTISELALFRDVQPETLRMDITNPRRLVYLKGNQVPRREIEDNFIFLVRGRALRSISSNGELYNFLDIRTSDSWLNESVLMPKKKSRLSIDVISEEAVILLIPTAEMNRLMNDEPHIMKRMLLYSVSETDKYQRLWTQM